MSEGETWREAGAEQEGREKVWGRSGESQRRSGRRFDLKMKCQFSSCPSNLHPKHRSLASHIPLSLFQPAL